MKGYALVTGASSGIGREMALYLDELGYPLILTSRDGQRLKALVAELRHKDKAVILPLDLSSNEGVRELWQKTKSMTVVMLVNNAGYGVYGSFEDTSLGTELNMIRLNVLAVHVLTKLFLKKFQRQGYGRILNVASVAGLMHGGPLMSSYYASKSYVVKLTEAIYQELKNSRSPVKVSLLCPGPVNTGFNRRAGVDFMFNGLSSRKVARAGIDGLLKGELLVIPGGLMKFTAILGKLLPLKVLIWGAGAFQGSKGE